MEANTKNSFHKNSSKGFFYTLSHEKITIIMVSISTSLSASFYIDTIETKFTYTPEIRIIVLSI